MKHIPARLLSASALTLTLGAALGGCSSAEPLTVSEAWAATTVGAEDPTETGVYLVIDNPGDDDVTLESASSPAAGHVVLHETTVVGGETSSEEVDGITVTAGRGKVLEPGGYHVMLLGLTEPLEVGDRVEVTLAFSDGTDRTLDVPVKEADGHDHVHADDHVQEHADDHVQEHEHTH